MTNEEFLREAEKSPECPGDFKKTYASFCQFQSLVVKTKQEFARICEKHNIHYQLAFGSLLGAVRDGGQIPWDYDVDCLVPFYEKEKLIHALETDLSKEFVYYTPENTHKYYPYFIRIVPKGFPHEILHVDVFYLVGIPDDENERKAYLSEVKGRYTGRRFACLGLSKNKHSFLGKAMIISNRIYYKLRYPKNDHTVLDKLFGKYDVRKVKEVITVTAHIGKYIYPSDLFLSSTKIDTREGTFYIPEKYQEFMDYRYGKWNEYLPVEDRISEVQKWKTKFIWYKENHMLPEDAPEI